MIEQNLFWEKNNTSIPLATSIWGAKSKTFDKVIAHFPENANILDLGCGDGRNSVYLAQYNDSFNITAVDNSSQSIKRLSERIKYFKIKNIEIKNEDCTKFHFDKQFDIVLLQGVLHFLEKKSHEPLISKIKAGTKVNGFNLISDFTNLLPFPEDIRSIFKSYLNQNELLNYYYKDSWDIILYEHYLLNDSHMNGTIHHTHDVISIFSKKMS